MLLLFCYYTTTILLLYYYYATVILILYYYYTATILLLDHYCTTTILLLYFYYATTIVLLYYWGYPNPLLYYYYYHCYTSTPQVNPGAAELTERESYGRFHKIAIPLSNTGTAHYLRDPTCRSRYRLRCCARSASRYCAGSGYAKQRQAPLDRPLPSRSHVHFNSQFSPRA